jgi:hypothetical protein
VCGEKVEAAVKQKGWEVDLLRNLFFFSERSSLALIVHKPDEERKEKMEKKSNFLTIPDLSRSNRKFEGEGERRRRQDVNLLSKL